jgi:hypothetical protein
VGNVEGVLDGDITGFIDAYLSLSAMEAKDRERRD